MGVMLKLFMLAGSIIIVHALQWGYPDLENEEEFSDWGGLCDVGKRQSPIDLSFTRAFKGIFDDYTFRNYEQPLINPRIENNGHTVRIKFDSPKLSVLGGGLKGEYFLDEVHFHWASEHTIDDRRYPLEMHAVHRNSKYRNATEAVKQADGFAVFGILFYVSSADNEDIAKILQQIDKVSDNESIGTPAKISEKLILQNFFPKNPSKNYFFYKGSLTTPTCAESVTWTVYSDTKPISLGQIEQFAKIEVGDGSRLKNNFRQVQKLRNRPVTFVSKWESNAKCSSGPIHFTTSGLLVPLVLLVHFILRKS